MCDVDEYEEAEAELDDLVAELMRVPPIHPKYRFHIGVA